MVENIVNAFVEFLESNNIPTQLIPFLVSLFPVLEIRGGMIAARALNIDFIQAFLVCYLGNMIPIPFILLFIRKIFALMRKVKFFGKIVDKLEARADKKKDTIVKYQEWGAFTFCCHSPSRYRRLDRRTYCRTYGFKNEKMSSHYCIWRICCRFDNVTYYIRNILKKDRRFLTAVIIFY